MLWQQSITQKVVKGLPTGIGSLVRITPTIVVKTGLNVWFNQALKASIDKNELDFLTNHSVRIVICDIQFTMLITLINNRIVINLDTAQEDACISASSYDFLRLIIGTLDPDTLFFRRRLTISGDTVLALRLKNFLDTQTVSEHLPKQLVSLLHKLTMAAESA